MFDKKKFLPVSNSYIPRFNLCLIPNAVSVCSKNKKKLLQVNPQHFDRKPCVMSRTQLCLTLQINSTQFSSSQPSASASIFFAPIYSSRFFFLRIFSFRPPNFPPLLRIVPGLMLVCLTCMRMRSRLDKSLPCPSITNIEGIFSFLQRARGYRLHFFRPSSLFEGE